MTPADRPPDERPERGEADDPTVDEGALSQSEGTRVPVDVSRDRALRLNWVVFLAGPVIWLVHFMVVYLAAEAGCTGTGPGLAAFAPPVPVTVTAVATVVAVGLCAGAAWWALQRWRASAQDVREDPERSADAAPEFDDEHRRSSLAFIGLLLSLLSLVAVLFTAAPAVVLGSC